MPPPLPGIAPAGASLRGVSEVLEGDSPPGILESLGRFLSRPLYAITSTLAGDPVGALRNLAHVPLDLLTGGFLDTRLSIPGRVFGDPESQRREVSDLLRATGVAHLDGAARFGTDLLGGLLLDPLTYLTLGTSAIAKGALTGLTRTAAARRVGAQLLKTEGGRGALDGARAAVAREWASDAAVGGGDELAKEWLASGGKIANKADAAAFGRRLDQKAVERVFDVADDGLADAEVVALMDAGVSRLEARQLIPRHGAVTVGIPGGPKVEITGSQGFWGFVGRNLTAPGLLHQLTSRYAPGATALVDAKVAELWNEVRGRFWDRTKLGLPREAGSLDATVRDNARRGVEAQVVDTLRVAARTAGLDERQTSVVGRLVDDFNDSYHSVVSDETIPTQAFRQAFEEGLADQGALLPRERSAEGWLDVPGRIAGLLRRFAPRQAEEVFPATLAERSAMAKEAPGHIAVTRRYESVPGHEGTKVLKTRTWRTEALSGAAIRDMAGDAAGRFPEGELRPQLVAGALSQELVRAAKEALPEVDPEKVEGLLDAYLSDMERIAKELHEVGRFKHGRGMPFYLPHQVTEEVLDLLPDAALNPALRAAIGSVFEQARTYKTGAEFREALKERISKLGYDVPDEVQEFDLRALWLRRLAAHNRTMRRSELFSDAKALLAKDGKLPDAVDRYLQAQLAPIPGRSRLLSVLLGGGTFRVPLVGGADTAAGRALAKRRGWKLVPQPGGGHVVEVPFSGLNLFWKPALTTTNPSYHFRNQVSSLVQALFDPDVGLAGLRSLLPTIRGVGVVEQLAKANWGDNDVALFLRALQGNSEALARVDDLPNYHNWTAKEVLGQLRGARYSHQSMADLMLDMRPEKNLGRFAAASKRRDPIAEVREFREKGFGGATLGLFGGLVGLAEQVANWLEGSARINAHLTLLAKGVEPAEAVDRVGRIFVNYDVNSVAERAVRDVFPFAKFSLASVAWLEEFARRPLTLTPLARAQSSARNEDTGAFLPEAVREGVGFPLGADRFAGSLGLPHESSLAMLGAVPTPGRGLLGLRRNVLGQIHPAFRLPLEAMVDRSFFFGTEWGRYRKAPNLLGYLGLDEPLAGVGVGEIVTGPGGRRTYEVDALFNEVLSASPFSRVVRSADAFFDARRSTWQKLVRGLTGVRDYDVDVDREAREAILRWLDDEVRAGRVAEARHFFSRLSPEETPATLQVMLEGLEAVKDRQKAQRETDRAAGGR